MVILGMIGLLAVIGFLCVSNGIAAMGLKRAATRRDARSPEQTTGK